MQRALHERYSARIKRRHAAASLKCDAAQHWRDDLGLNTETAGAASSGRAGHGLGASNAYVTT